VFIIAGGICFTNILLRYYEPPRSKGELGRLSD